MSFTLNSTYSLLLEYFGHFLNVISNTVYNYIVLQMKSAAFLPIGNVSIRQEIKITKSKV